MFQKSIVALILILACCGTGVARAATRVEKVVGNVWHVRASRGESFTTSLMDRYGFWPKWPALETSDSLDFGVVSVRARHVGEGFELRFPLVRGERVYGLGDSSRESFQRRPGIYDIWVKNIIGYIPIPFVMTSHGWGVVLNVTHASRFDIGKTHADEMVVTAEKGEIDFYLLKGADYAELLDSYTHLTGRPCLLPAFGYGAMYIANMFVDEFEICNQARRFRDYGIPCDGFGLEPGWMEYFYDFTTKKQWNTKRFHFPVYSNDPKITCFGALDRLGFKLSLWICMNYDLFVFEEACAEGKACVSREKAKGSDLPVEGFFDEHTEGRFSEKESVRLDKRSVDTRADLALGTPVFRPDNLTGREQDGKEPWFEHLKKFVDRGARCFKMDAACQVFPSPDRIWAGKYTDAEVHNLYPLVYAKQMHEGFAAYTDKRPFLITPDGYTGYQKYAVSWAGDTGGGPKTLLSAHNLSMSGQPHQSCDLDVDRVERLHYAFLSSWTMQNNWYYHNEPWNYDDKTMNVYRKYARMRYSLFPYLYGAAARAHRSGWPIVRPLAFVYPQNESYADTVTTYLLGDNLLVGVFDENVEIPEGAWFDWRSGEEVRGPCRKPIVCTSDWGGALFVKAGAVIPQWPVKGHIDGGWNQKVILHAYLGADGVSEWYEDDGVSLAYLKDAFSVCELRLEGRTLTIVARKGSFEGMPDAHDITVVWHKGPKTKATELGRVPANETTTVSAPWFWW